MNEYPDVYRIPALRQKRDDDEIMDLNKEFTCFLCNGVTTLLGSVELDKGMIHFVSSAGYIMETVQLSQIVSVNELEPVRGDALFITMGFRYVLLSYLLRKDQLLKYFKDNGLYQADIKLPPEAVGFLDPEATLVLDSEEESRLAKQQSLHSTDPNNQTTTLVPSPHHALPHGVDRDVTVKHSPNCPLHHGGQCPVHGRQVMVKYNFRFDNMAPMKQLHKEPYDPLPQTDTPSVRTPDYYRQTNSYTARSNIQQTDSNVTANTSPPPKQKSTTTKPIDKTSLVKGLKMLFPSHQEDALRKALEETKYVMDDAITVLLEQNELANT